jgi:hypothetical protein
VLAEVSKPCGVDCDDVWRSEAVADVMARRMRKKRLLVQQEATAAVNFFPLSLGEIAGHVRRHVTAPLASGTPPAPNSPTIRNQAQRFSTKFCAICTLIRWAFIDYEPCGLERITTPCSSFKQPRCASVTNTLWDGYPAVIQAVTSIFLRLWFCLKDGRMPQMSQAAADSTALSSYLQ